MSFDPHSALRRLVLVRHGETIGESSVRYYGATDVPLSAGGREQMQRVGAVLAGQRFDAIYTSVLSRTVEAARIIAPQSPAQALVDFNEVDFGSWEGLTREEIAARDPQLFRQWQAQLGEFTYPGGDAVPLFRARVQAAWRRIFMAAPPCVLVIAHKGIIRTIVTDLLTLTPEERANWPIDLGSIHVLVAGDRAWRVEQINDMRHLEGAA